MMPSTRRLAALVLALAASSGCDRLLPPHQASYDPHLDCNGGDGCVCAEHYADCNGDTADGCESYTESDPRHCGGCDVDCRGGACVDGMCESITIYASRGFNATAFALHADRVYVTDTESAVLALRPEGDGFVAEAVVDFYPAEHRGGTAVAARDRVLYAINDPLPDEGEERIFWSPLDGSLGHEGIHARGDTLVTFDVPTQRELQIPGFSETYAYFLDAKRRLCRMDLAARVMTCLEDNVPSARVLPDRAYWFGVDGLRMIRDVEAEPSTVLAWAKIPAKTELERFAADGDDVFFLSSSAKGKVDLQRYHVGDPDPQIVATFDGILLNTAGYVSASVDLDADALYVLTGSAEEQAIWRVPRGVDAPVPQRLSPKLGGVGLFRVGSDALYWSQPVFGPGTYFFGGTLHRLVKPAP
jgi:hypothetical protein